MGGVGSVSVRVRGRSESSFGIGRVSCMGSQDIGTGQKSRKCGNFSVGKTHDYMKFYYDSMNFYMRF